MPNTPAVTYDRPITAKLIVRLEANGEEWEASEADIARFAEPLLRAAYYRFTDGLSTALLGNGVDLGHKNDIGNTILNPIRNLAETTIYFGWEAVDHLNVGDLAAIAGIEHALRAQFAPDGPCLPALFDNRNLFEHTPLSTRMEHLVEAQRLLRINDEHAVVAERTLSPNPRESETPDANLDNEPF